MSTHRDLTAVIGDMLGVIPADEEVLRQRLVALRESASFTAPELMRDRWFDVARVLQSEICPPREEWQHNVAAMFSNRPRRKS